MFKLLTMFKLLSFSLLFLSLFATNVHAEDWKLLPVFSSDYKPDFAFAIVGGVQNIDDSDATEVVYGGEVSLNCPLLRVPNHTIRTQLGVVNYDHDNVSILAIDLSPQHMFEIVPSLTFGLGPVIGASRVELGSESSIVLDYGAEVSARYNISSRLFAAAEAHYVWTTSVDIGNSDVDFNNARYLMKVGYQL